MKVIELPALIEQFNATESSDIFVFRTDTGHDVITDFVAGATSDDTIRIEGFNITNFAEIMDLAEQNGDDTIITFDADNSITLEEVQLTALHADDFQFV